MRWDRGADGQITPRGSEYWALGRLDDWVMATILVGRYRFQVLAVAALQRALTRSLRATPHGKDAGPLPGCEVTAISSGRSPGEASQAAASKSGRYYR